MSEYRPEEDNANSMPVEILTTKVRVHNITGCKNDTHTVPHIIIAACDSTLSIFILTSQNVEGEILSPSEAHEPFPFPSASSHDSTNLDQFTASCTPINESRGRERRRKNNNSNNKRRNEMKKGRKKRSISET